jgi:hypothetical protein
MTYAHVDGSVQGKTTRRMLCDRVEFSFYEEVRIVRRAILTMSYSVCIVLHLWLVGSAIHGD